MEHREIIKRAIIGFICLWPALVFWSGPGQRPASAAQAPFRDIAQGTPPTPTPTPILEVNGIDKIDPKVQAVIQSLPAGDTLTVIVRLKTQANLRNVEAMTGLNPAARLSNVIQRLQSTANNNQQSVKTLLERRRAEGQVSQIIPFWIFNGLAVTAAPKVIWELAAQPEVLRISPNETFQAPVYQPEPQGFTGLSTSEPNLTLINAPALWAAGFTGQGIVVANLDTGVDVNHPDLNPKWRGGLNSWFDPYGQHPTTPTDFAGGGSGHGTQTMGVMVGGADNGAAFGLAPAAQWIAVKVFKDNGAATAVAFHQGFQWLLDPDDNPATPDAPDVVNNSWTAALGCNLEFQEDLQALRAAGILPIFAAGNYGPNPSTSASPANYPEAFAVGAVSNSNFIKNDSSRGPSACDDTIFPEVVAPGVSVHTTDRFGLYTNVSGTSFAAPHIAGGLALLLSAAPDLTAVEQETVLLNSVVDLGTAGPDHTYGQGRIDLLAAFQSLFDLEVVHSGLPDPITAYRPLSYTLTIVNNGPLTATTVALNDEWPSPAIFEAAIPSQGSCSPPGDNVVTCTLGDLVADAGAVVTMTVLPPMPGLLTNTVTVTGIKPDLHLENNTAMIAAQVIEQVDLAVAHSGLPDPITAYRPLRYTLTIVNNGPLTATAVVLNDEWPSVTIFEAAIPGQGRCRPPNDGVVTCTLGDLAEDASAVVTMTVLPTRSGLITNTVTVTGLKPDFHLENNTATVAAQVIEQVYLPLITK